MFKKIIAMTELLKVKNGMTSQEIAEITGKRHADIMRDIRNLLEQGVSERNFALSSYKQSQPKGGFKEIPCYDLTPKGVLILASGYNPLLREKIINRLEELEEQKEKNEQIRSSSESSTAVLTNTFDISALTGKPHATILKDVRKILEQGAGAGDFIKSYGPVQMECGTREYESYDITPKGLLTLATGYPPLLRDLIVAKYVEITGGGSMKTVMRSEKPAAEDVHEYEKRNAELWRIIEEKNRIIDGLKAGIQPSVPQKEEDGEEEDAARPMLVHEMRMRIKEECGIVIPYRRMFALLVKMGWAIRNERYTNKPGAVAVRKGYVLECDSKGVKDGAQFYTLRITEKGYRKFVDEVIGKGGVL